MAHEVVVVGGGIGGLTAAALLAARGVNVCLLEKESRGGGCAVTFERFGYTFEAGRVALRVVAARRDTHAHLRGVGGRAAVGSTGQARLRRAPA